MLEMGSWSGKVDVEVGSEIKMTKIKKFTNTLIIILLLFSFGNFLAKEIYAQEATPTPTETTVNNDATVENSTDQTADTGNNSIEAEPSPSPEPSASPDVSPSPEPSAEPQSSPDPSPSPSPEPSPDTSLNNDASVENNVDSTSDTGNNSISEPEVDPTAQEASESADLSNEEATSSAEIDSGNAISVVEAENSVNSTEVNSEVVNQTLNIFVSEDVDLSLLPYVIAEAIFAENNQDQAVINVAIFNGQNFAYLSNDIVSLANSGQNSISGADQATIKTGDAYSVVSVVNKVNTTIVDSIIHIVTINIFGTINGNIILPEFIVEGGCCGEITQINNQASVENNVSSSAVSGQNEIVTQDSGSIQTGDASSAVNVVNIVNKSLIGILFHYLFINNFGEWNGNFLGWDDLLAQSGGGSLALASTNGNGEGGCPTCPQDIYLNNEAAVYNNISSTSNTGGNYIGEGFGSIKTGRAYSVVSLLNFVNSSIIRSVGFFGFINIFGTWNGDIGGESQFQVQEEEVDQETVEVVENQEQEGGPSIREQGGKLDVEFSHNVGEYILPGDTITFFVKVKNTGTGKVYNGKIKISFIKDGVDMGGVIFDISDIEAGKGKLLTTGLVMSEDMLPGLYIARVTVWGEAGEDGLVSDFADASFWVGGGGGVASSIPIFGGLIGEVYADEFPLGEVLGVKKGGLTMQQIMWIVLIGCSLTYLMLKGVRERRKIALALLRSRNYLAAKSLALRSYLFTHFPPFL